MKILVLDNYDSFTYNLVHMVKELGYGANLETFRNDKITLNEVDRFDKILLSPGPGLPRNAGIMPDLIRDYAPTKSILGICLGHQAIAEAFGASIYNMSTVLHGVADQVKLIKENDLFSGLPKEFSVCRYHSWSVVPKSLNGSLEVTAVDKNENVMGLKHVNFDVYGLQFHPESIITEYGKEVLNNWLSKKL